mgnify:CR=1 FL=1
MEKKRTMGLVTVTGSYVLWGLLPVFWSLLSGVNSVYILAQRILWSMVFMGLFLLVTRGWGEILAALKNRRILGLSLICGVLITLNWGVYIYAVNSGHVLDASMGYFIEPVLVAVVGLLVFREKPTLAEKLTFCCAAAGVVFLILRTGSVPTLALLIAAPFAFYGAVKKNLPLSAQASLFMETLCMVPFALLFAKWWESQAGGVSGVLHGAAFWLLPACGVVTSVPMLLFNLGVKEVPYYFVGILMYINPTLQFLMGLFCFHEAMDLNRFLAFAIIWVGLILMMGEKLFLIRKENQAAGEPISPER